MSDGWVKDGAWYYYSDGEVTIGWKQIDGDWYYFNSPGGSMGWSKVVGNYYLGSDGRMVTNEGWQKNEKGVYYYVGANEKVFRGWKQVGDYWYYFYDDASMAWGRTVDDCYLNLDGQWVRSEGWQKNEKGIYYYVGANERVFKGWNKVGSKFYYFNKPGGSMTWDNDIDGFHLNNDGEVTGGTGWLKDNNTGEWYYYSDGEMKTGWVQYGDTWYYMDTDGKMATGWRQVNGFWYYLNSTGEMATGWKNDGNGWYYLYADGSMTYDNTVEGYHVDQSGKMITGTGWVPSDGNLYYLKDDGSVAINWQIINGNWYYLYPQGSMAKDVIIKGWYVDSSGKWIEDYKPDNSKNDDSQEISDFELDINYDKINNNGTENWQNWKDELSDAIKENIKRLPSNLSEKAREKQVIQIVEKLTKALQVKYKVIYSTYKLAPQSEEYKTLEPLYQLYKEDDSYTKIFFKGFFGGFEEGLYFSTGERATESGGNGKKVTNSYTNGGRNPNLTEPSLSKGGKLTEAEIEMLTSKETSKGHQAELDTAKLFKKEGYKIEPLEEVEGGNGHGLNDTSNPDYLIEDQPFDCYAPESRNPKTVVKEISKKNKEQTERITLNLDNYQGDIEELKDMILRKTNGDLKNLKELLVVKDGEITRWFTRGE
ncbi:hypothetical protein [Clostridium saccharoperbutylacetonicum]|uniref:CdiA C-terminal domain-containing protein n=1 Tax=Clostridium saccharoperbutylacetonicum TaxID=36745 RepID=UPI0039E87F75